MTKPQSEEVANRTRGQAENNLWYEARTGILTASRMLAVIRKLDDDCSIQNQVSTDNLVSNILGYKPQVSTKATKWGKLNEPVAIQKYQIRKA